MASRFFRKCWLAAVLGMTSGASLIAAPLQLPALVAPASQEHHVGKVIFLELVTPDLTVAKRFYRGLFGWTFRDIQADGMAYAEALFDGHQVAGLIQRAIPAGQQRQPAWLSSIAVRDVDAVKSVALQHGAKVLFGPRSRLLSTTNATPHCVESLILAAPIQ